MRPALLRRVAREESGMTLLELLNVVVIMGILLLIAIPSYLSLKDRASQSTAKSNIRAVLPSVILYAQDNTPGSTSDPDGDPSDSGWTGLSVAALQHYDPTIDPSRYQTTGSATTFCIYTWVGAFTASQAGPGSPITTGFSSSFSPESCSG
jgi:prepilin-type N-terminal cleavage/methylation domain-containing protein